MTVTFTVMPGLDVRSGYYPEHPTDLPHECNHEDHADCPIMLFESVTDDLLDGPHSDGSLNGFVWAAVQAYNEKRTLIIRPDDVWVAILTQLNLHVNSHPEELRGEFVASDGPIELKIVHNGPFGTYDWAKFPKEMVDKFEPFLAPTTRQWVSPNFSTTKPTDTLVCSVIMMSTLQHHLRAKPSTARGIPAVKVLGTKSDWESILTRIGKLSGFSKETEAWYKLLLPVISRCIEASEYPNSPENKEFWQKVARQPQNMSGIDCLSGWITAFCYWDQWGQKLHGRPGYHCVNLDGADFYQVGFNEVPLGAAVVPVKVDDNGDVYGVNMIAGSIVTGSTTNNTLRPAPGVIILDERKKC